MRQLWFHAHLESLDLPAMAQKSCLRRYKAKMQMLDGVGLLQTQRKGVGKGRMEWHIC